MLENKARAATVFATVAATAAIGAPLALAAKGDKTLAISAHSAELATNKCKGASISSVVTGAPGVPDTYDIYLSSPYRSCTARARFIGVASDGKTVFKTPFVYMRGGREAVLPVDNVYRCYIEFGVQRKNHRYFTRNLLPTKQENQNCPE